MADGSAVGAFLRTRRDRVLPEQVDLVRHATRRVPGLRREEVALLAGISVEYYAQLERGDLGDVSDAVLTGLTRALRLDAAETAHLFSLAGRVQQAHPETDRSAVRAGLRRLLDGLTEQAAWIRTESLDLVASNDLSRALHRPLYGEAEHPNHARAVFLDQDASRSFYPDWATVADDVTATLRGYLGQNPGAPTVTSLVGELRDSSPEFAARWDRHDVRFHRSGTKRVSHCLVGDLSLSYEVLDLPADPGWHLYVYSAEPDSVSHDRLLSLSRTR